jgi:hypothetical protein
MQAEAARTVFSSLQRGQGFDQVFKDPGMSTNPRILEMSKKCLEKPPYWIDKFEAGVLLITPNLWSSTFPGIEAANRREYLHS